MFVGQTGVERILRRTAEATRGGADPKAAGVIPFEMVQRAVNLWYSLSLDLFGGEDSSNAALFFGAGLKGRDLEHRLDEHLALEQHYTLERVVGERLVKEDVPLRRAMNEVLRDAYVGDCEKVVRSWNRALEEVGSDYRVTLPSRRFNRAQGLYAGMHFTPEGEMISAQAFEASRAAWLPTEEDRAYMRALQTRAYTKPGEFAPWIAPPARGIDGQPLDFEYVKFCR